MRLGKRFIQRKTQREISRHTETRNAIVWDIIQSEKKARIKIQGSNELVTAYYPENWEQTPRWLKKGNAVLVTHVGGNRQRIELSGFGQYIPTAVTGGSLPDTTSAEDTVLYGLNGVQAAIAKMAVWITTGAIRMNGVTYESEYITMEATSTITMSNGGMLMGTGYIGEFNIDAAHSTLFRYDMFVMGTDGIVDYVKGTAATIPTMPSVPANHLKLFHILIYPNMTEIISSDINKIYDPPKMSYIGLTATNTDMTWTDTISDITVTISDQYGNTYSSQAARVKFSFEMGDGLINGVSELEITVTGSATVTYTRGGLVTDESPMIKAEVVTKAYMMAFIRIYVQDEAGDPMF